MSPNMGKSMGDLEMARKPVTWDEPRSAVDPVRDLEVGMGGLLDEKDARFSDPEQITRENLPIESIDNRMVNSSRSSWGHRSNTSSELVGEMTGTH